MNTLNKIYTNTAYQGYFEILPNKGYTADNTFSYVNKIIHRWVIRKFGNERIPRTPKSWVWTEGSRSIYVHHNYDNRIYCIKVAHEDDLVAGRMWTVETSVSIKENRIYLAVRTFYTSENRNRDYQLCNPPKFVNSIAANCCLYDGGETLDQIHTIDTEEEVDKLYLIINDKSRVFPVIVISEDQSQDEGIKFLQSNEEGYHIDGAKLAKSLRQIAHIYYLPLEYQNKWVEMLSMKWAVTNGAVRTYNPGFDIDEEESMTLLDHPIALPKNILPMNYINDNGEEIIAGHAFRHLLTHGIKRDNMYRRFRWDEKEVKFYQQIMKESDIEAEKSTDELRQEIQMLKDEIDENKNSYDQLDEFNNELLSEINKRKSEIRASLQRIIDLENRLKEYRDFISVDYPEDYKSIPDWVSTQFPGRLELHKKALKCLKDNPAYPDIELLCKAIEFLGKEYYEMKTGRLEMKECESVRLSLGIENSPTGSVASAGRQSKAYNVNYNGRDCRLEMHIKGGKSMNSSDARERFRIYYFWDDDDQKVIIGHLPDHLPLSES